MHFKNQQMRSHWTLALAQSTGRIVEVSIVRVV